MQRELSSLVNIFNAKTWLRPTSWCLDLGSASTRVIVDQKVVYNQPTCVTFHEASQTLLTIGSQALLSRDKLPKSVRLVRPIEYGTVTEPLVAELYLKAVVQEISDHLKVLPSILGLRGVLGVPALLTPVQNQMFQNVMKQAGFLGLKMVPKVEAIRAVLLKTSPTHAPLCLIDVGAQTTEVGLFFQDRLVHQTTIRVGGSTYTQEVLSVLRDEYECEIGWLTAEEVKSHFRNVPAQSGEKTTDYKIAIRGKNLVTGSPLTVSVSSNLLQAHFNDVTQELIDELKFFLAQVPAELLTEALEAGLFVTGGGSLLPGVVEKIGDGLKSPFSLSAQPMMDVVKGLCLV